MLALLVARRSPTASRTAAATMVLAALPDVFQLLLLFGWWWWWGDGTLANLRAYGLCHRRVAVL